MATTTARKRLRELGVSIGRHPTGPLNAITDVAGVRVGHTTIIAGEGALDKGKGPVRTGPLPLSSAPSPAMIVVCPTRTPATSVMALSGPVGWRPIDTPSSRNRLRAVVVAIGYVATS